MRFVTNIYKHEIPQSSSRWANKFIRGRPQATETYTVEQLEAMGFVGLYKADDDETTAEVANEVTHNEQDMPHGRL